MVKLKRLDSQKKAQEALNHELLDDILHRATQPNELKRLIEGLWDYPKLYLPLFNTFAKKEEVRALYKGQVQIVSVDFFSSLHIFPVVVSEVIYKAEKWFQDILKVKIFSGIKNREIETVVLSFRSMK